MTTRRNNLAKVGVGGSNPLARSKVFNVLGANWVVPACSKSCSVEQGAGTTFSVGVRGSTARAQHSFPPVLSPIRQRPHIVSMKEIDWSRCPDIDSDPGRCSGAWCVKGTRLMVQAILDNAEDCTPEEIANEIFEVVTVEQVRRILDFAGPSPLMFGEGEPTALLLAMVAHHCSTAQPDELDSHGIEANAEAMMMLHDAGYIEITNRDGERIFANLLPAGRTLLESLRGEQEQWRSAGRRS